MFPLPSPLVFGTLVKRYKRFFADIVLEDGTAVIAHCPNPGAMLGVLEPGNRVALTKSGNPLRKLAYTWHYVQVEGTWVGINTHLTNEIVASALANKTFPEFKDYDLITREVKYGANSRIDFLLTKEGAPPCYLEVKNVHLKRNGVAQFPDCVTARGAKHMAELAAIRQQGARCVVLYVVQRGDCTEFSLADDIDPVYAKASALAKESGVEMLAYSCSLNENEVSFLQQKLLTY